jgi:hypothetical protein
MAIISSDHDLRERLSTLSTQQQRIMGARFAKGVMHLNRDERVSRAAETALNPDASEGELGDAFKAAKAYATKTYTDCGKDTDWLAQADHFVAAAVAAALTPEAQMSERINPAWKAAVQARMANNCALMEQDEDDSETEAQRQYRIASENL